MGSMCDRILKEGRKSATKDEERVIFMWLISEDGFTSVVRYVPTKDKVNKEHRALAENSDNPADWLIVRARVKADLERIEAVSGLNLHISTDASADYAYRGLCATSDWQQYMIDAIARVDYDSHFKEVVRDRAPKVADRYSGMMGIWSIMAKWQDLKPYGGLGSGYSGWGIPSYSTPGGYSSGSKGKKWEPAPIDLSDDFAPGDYSVSLTDMAGLLKDVEGIASAVPADSVNNATDAGFELWVRAGDAAEHDTPWTAGQIDDKVADIIATEDEQ